MAEVAGTQGECNRSRAHQTIFNCGGYSDRARSWRGSRGGGRAGVLAVRVGVHAAALSGVVPVIALCAGAGRLRGEMGVVSVLG